MLVLVQSGQSELTIKNSIFVSEMFTVHTPDEARERLKAQKERYAGWGHIVHAFVVGNTGGILGCSDDGEPSGTAGRPTLEVLKGSGITNVILTTARHFGGIKLGTGGLVKAYTESAQLVLRLSTTAELVPMSDFTLQIPYPCYDHAKRAFAAVNAEIQTEDFSNGITFTGRVRAEHTASLSVTFRDMSRGQAIFSVTTEENATTILEK